LTEEGGIDILLFYSALSFYSINFRPLPAGADMVPIARMQLCLWSSNIKPKNAALSCLHTSLSFCDLRRRRWLVSFWRTYI